MPVLSSPEEQPWAGVRDQITQVAYTDMGNISVPNMQYWFTDCVNLTRAEIPYTTQVIGTEAFANCPSLTEVLFYYYDSDNFEIVEGAFFTSEHVDTKIYVVSEQADAFQRIKEYSWDNDNRHAAFYDVYGVEPVSMVYVKSSNTHCPLCGSAELETGNWCSVCAVYVLPCSNTDSTSVICSLCGHVVCSAGDSDICTCTPVSTLYDVVAFTSTQHHIIGYCGYCGLETSSAWSSHNYYAGVCYSCDYGKTVTINFNVDGVITPITQTIGTTIIFPSPPTKDGYSFRGWYSAPSQGSPVSCTVTVTDAATYYAQWEEAGPFDSLYEAGIYFYLDEDCGDCSETYMERYEPDTAGYHIAYIDCRCRSDDSRRLCIDNWDYCKGSGGYDWNDCDSLGYGTADGVCDYCGQTIPKVTITWNNSGATSTTTHTPGESLTLPANPTKTGYTFKGWYTASSGGTQVTASTLVPSSATTYYAQWTINTSTLTINPNGGTWGGTTSNSTKTQNYNTTLTVANPTITNYTATFNSNGGSSVSSKTTNKAFSSWTKSSTFTAGTLSGTTFTFGATKGGTGTLTASWSGSYAITLPAAPTKSGYTFNGWYTAASGGTKIGNAGASVTLSSSVTYYAQWTANTYTSTWVVDGTTYDTITQTFGSSFIYPSEPTKQGYTFDGWYTTASGTGEKYTTTTWRLTGNRTIYARWTANTYTITWDSGSGAHTTTQMYDTALALPTQPTKLNAHFGGWWTASTGGTVVNESTTFQTASDVTYYAQWVQAFSVTVPTTLPIAMAPDGTAKVAASSITNNSTGSVTVTGVTVTALNDWSVVPYNSDMSTQKVDAKLIGLRVSDIETTTLGASQTFTTNWTIAENGSLSLDSSANVSALSQSASNKSVLEIVFIISWTST